MFSKPMQPFQGVAAGSIATMRVPAEDFTLCMIKLNLGGTTFNKSLIDRVRVKVGPKYIWDLTYAQINKINNYKNGADNNNYLLLDFTERDQPLFPVKEVGGLDLMMLAQSVGEVYVEVTINSGAVAPTMAAVGYFEQQQTNPWVLKFLPFSFTQSASGRFTLPLQFRGALLKRLWLHYNGTAWTATTNGNLNRMECKKNGIVFFDQTDLDNRFDQTQFKKVPQPGVYVVDFILDNNHDAHVTTIRNTKTGMIYDSFEFNAYLSDAGGATITAVAEVLDTVTNL